MKTNTKLFSVSALAISIALLVLTACQLEQDPTETTTEVPSGRKPDASVVGSVTYRERLALTPDANLVVELRDVSYADASAPLIARETIADPGQVPIEFKVDYSREDIDPRNRYSLSARIVESDGRLAFTNDTAHEVITNGNPNNVDMVLVLVQPPPELIDDPGAGSPDWRTWVETPVTVAWANLVPNEPENLLRIAYYQSTVEGCVRPGSSDLVVQGFDIIARVTLMQPPPTAWAIPCDKQLVQLDTVAPIAQPLEPVQTYRVLVNGIGLTTFTLPRPSLAHPFIAESPIESAEVVALDGAPAHYELRVVSGLPTGSGCSQFNGYEIRREEPNAINVVVTHHQVGDPEVFCTAEYPTVETTVPLGGGFESGLEYTVNVNSGLATSFIAR